MINGRGEKYAAEAEPNWTPCSRDRLLGTSTRSDYDLTGHGWSRECLKRLFERWQAVRREDEEPGMRGAGMPIVSYAQRWGVCVLPAVEWDWFLRDMSVRVAGIYGVGAS